MANRVEKATFGPIEVPADKFKNWVGGFTDTNAALDYASSGGIPVVGIVSNGQIAKVQLEHVWVEAAIDLTALFARIDPCLSVGLNSLIVKTKSSPSPSASLDDFTGPVLFHFKVGATVDAGPDRAECSQGDSTLFALSSSF